MSSKKYYIDIDLQKNSLVKARFENLSSPPLSPGISQTYFDTTLNKLGFFDGSIWIYIGIPEILEWEDSAIADIQYIKTTTGVPLTMGATTGELLLNVFDNILYTSTSGDTWDGGVSLLDKERYIFKENGTGSGAGVTFTFNNNIYESDGSSVTDHTPTTGSFISVDDDVNNVWYYGGSLWVAKSFESTLFNTSNKFETPTASAGNESPTGIVIGQTPVKNSYPHVLINSILAEVGSGVKTKSCYFSADGGTTAKAFASLELNDELIWNGVISGYELDTNDRVCINFNTKN